MYHSAMDESALVWFYQPIHVWYQSTCQNFRKKLGKAVDETYGPKIADRISIFPFLQEHHKSLVD